LTKHAFIIFSSPFCLLDPIALKDASKSPIASWYLTYHEQSKGDATRPRDKRLTKQPMWEPDTITRLRGRSGISLQTVRSQRNFTAVGLKSYGDANEAGDSAGRR
jgi:hypothetical protein